MPGEGPPEPEFQAGASINIADSYVSNAGGYGGSFGSFGSANRPDYVSMIGGSAYLHEHSRRVTLDATYSGDVDFYARGSVPTQINNNLQAVGNLDVVPRYLTLTGKAFAQPIVISSLGIVTADNRLVPNGFSNSYGYAVSPDLRFNLGEFATSETAPGFGQIFFVNPPGSFGFSAIPGLFGPQDTTSRNLLEKISSGRYFERLNWDLNGAFTETARPQGVLAEKAGIANLRYAVSYEFSLLATAGYDAITNSTRLNQNLSGPVFLGGFGLKFGSVLVMQVQAGEKYRSPSYTGTLLWNFSPTASISAAVDDAVQTPEGQLLGNLTNLSARSDGSLGLDQDKIGNGATPSLSAFSLQSQGSFSLDQNISRYQTASVTLAKEFERYHASIGAYGNRRTILSGVFIGPMVSESWGGFANLSHDFTPILQGSVGGSYGVSNEFGGAGRTFEIHSQLNYQLSRKTSIFAGVDYLDRSSSASLQSLSPFLGNLNDFRATIGVSHAL